MGEYLDECAPIVRLLLPLAVPLSHVADAVDADDDVVGPADEAKLEELENDPVGSGALKQRSFAEFSKTNAPTAAVKEA